MGVVDDHVPSHNNVLLILERTRFLYCAFVPVDWMLVGSAAWARVQNLQSSRLYQKGSKQQHHSQAEKWPEWSANYGFNPWKRGWIRLTISCCFESSRWILQSNPM
jgi:hypothetical protein